MCDSSQGGDDLPLAASDIGVRSSTTSQESHPDLRREVLNNCANRSPPSFARSAAEYQGYRREVARRKDGRGRASGRGLAGQCPGSLTGTARARVESPKRPVAECPGLEVPRPAPSEMFSADAAFSLDHPGPWAGPYAFDRTEAVRRAGLAAQPARAAPRLENTRPPRSRTRPEPAACLPARPILLILAKNVRPMDESARDCPL